MYKNPRIQTLKDQTFATAKTGADVLRLDLVHPVVSGNKWYKLRYHLARAREEGRKSIISFGGAYSNHLTALAFACEQERIPCAGIIRGEMPSALNHSLKQMQAHGMRLIFVDRETYRLKNIEDVNLPPSFLDAYVVPEGGAGPEGVKGASDILEEVGSNIYSHIICSVGTGTTLAGLVNASCENQQVMGISALKIPDGGMDDLLQYIASATSKRNYQINTEYHFGGYAKRTAELISFMNRLYRDHQIPTDFVYTAKLFYAVFDLTAKNHFPPDSRLLIIHSGGLQGNRSLEKGTLTFDND